MAEELLRENLLQEFERLTAYGKSECKVARFDTFIPLLPYPPGIPYPENLIMLIDAPSELRICKEPTPGLLDEIVVETRTLHIFPLEYIASMLSYLVVEGEREEDCITRALARRRTTLCIAGNAIPLRLSGVRVILAKPYSEVLQRILDGKYYELVKGYWRILKEVVNGTAEDGIGFLELLAYRAYKQLLGGIHPIGLWLEKFYRLGLIFIVVPPPYNLIIIVIEDYHDLYLAMKLLGDSSMLLMAELF
ncbi:MAG: hypothetical protein ABWW69_05310 [Pyrodictiaceae archaeon]